MFIPGQAPAKPFILSPRLHHCRQTEAVWVFHVLFQASIESTVALEDEPDFFHQLKKANLVFRRYLDLEDRGNWSIIRLRQVAVEIDPDSRIRF